MKTAEIELIRAGFIPGMTDAGDLIAAEKKIGDNFPEVKIVFVENDAGPIRRPWLRAEAEVNGIRVRGQIRGAFPN